MAAPGDEEAAGHGYLRADREQMIETLKAAFVQGRVTQDEFEARVAQVLAAGTYAQLASVTADLPAVPLPAAPSGRPVSSAARWGAAGLITPIILAATFASAAQPGDGAYAAVVFVIACGYFLFWLSVGADMLWDWHCTALPGAGLCARCGHAVASHRTPACCTSRLGSPHVWGRCPYAGYVPPGTPPLASGLRPLPWPAIPEAR